MSDPVETIREWVIKGKKNEAVAATREALAAGTDPGAIMKDGLIAAMAVVGQKYSSGEFFLPQMMIAARAMTEVITVLKPHLVGAAAERMSLCLIVSERWHSVKVRDKIRFSSTSPTRGALKSHPQDRL